MTLKHIFLLDTIALNIKGVPFTVNILLLGFHEAIGDTIALSVSTPSHLRNIEKFLNSSRAVAIYEEQESSEEEMTIQEKENINFLMKTALAKVSRDL